MAGTRIGGKKAYNHGKTFEEILDLNARLQGAKVIHHPMGCRRAGKTFVPVRTPHDFTLGFKGIAVFLDTKTYDSDRITHSQITEHQISTLLDFEEEGFTAGYLIYFRPENAICFAKASWLKQLKPGDSLHGRHMIYIGSLEEFYVGRLFSIHMESENGTTA